MESYYENGDIDIDAYSEILKFGWIGIFRKS